MEAMRFESFDNDTILPHILAKLKGQNNIRNFDVLQ